MSFTWKAAAESLPALRGARERTARPWAPPMQACRVDIGGDHPLEVVTHGDFAGPAALFLEAEHPPVAGEVEVAAVQPGRGARAGGGIGENGQDGAIAQPDDAGFLFFLGAALWFRRARRCEKLASVLYGDFRGLALDDLVALLADCKRRVRTRRESGLRRADRRRGCAGRGS